MKIGTLQNQTQAIKFLNTENGVRKALSDSLCKGLQLERLALGRGRWRVRYINNRGRRQCHTLGDAPAITLTEARELTNQIRAQIALGHDPSAEKKAAQSVPTFAEFIHRFYLPHIDTYKKSAASDRSYLRCQILPVLGNKYLDEISRESIADLQRDLIARGYKPGSINRALILIRFAFNLAIKWGMLIVTKNPAREVPLLPDPDGKRERFLTPEETARLFDAVQKSPNPMLQYIIPMLIMTGARKREVLDCKWEDFDLQRSQWKIPTTKAGRPRYVPISMGVINLLATIPRNDCPYVFANPKTGKPYVSIFNSWNRARKQAGLDEIRIHDLRHSFASFLINGGRSIYEVQRILGHTQIKTTQRYAHLSADTLLAAADFVGNLIANTCLTQCERDSGLSDCDTRLL